MAWLLSYTLYQEISWVIDPRAIIGHLRLPRCWSEGLTMIQILFKQHDLRTTVGGSIMVRGRPIRKRLMVLASLLEWSTKSFELHSPLRVKLYLSCICILYPQHPTVWRHEDRTLKEMYVYTAKQQLNYGKQISRSIFSFWTMMNLKKCVKPHCRITSCESRLHTAQTSLLYYYFSFRLGSPLIWQGQILASKVTVVFRACLFAVHTSLLLQVRLSGSHWSSTQTSYSECNILQPHGPWHPTWTLLKILRMRISTRYSL